MDRKSHLRAPHHRVLRGLPKEHRAHHLVSAMTLLTEVLHSELPYRVEVDGLKGAGISPSAAVIAALSVGKRIPPGLRDRKDVAAYLLWHYEANPEWVRLIEILCHDTFAEIKKEKP